MFTTGNLVRETLASAPGVGNFTLPGAPSAGGPYRTWASAIGQGLGATGGQRWTLYVARTTTQFEIGIGFFDGVSTIYRGAPYAPQILDGSAGRGVVVNFTTAPDVYCELPAHLLTYSGIDSRPIFEYFEDFQTAQNGTHWIFQANGSGAGSSSVGSQSSGASAGLVNLNSGTSGSSYSAVQMPTGNGGANATVPMGQGALVSEAMAKVASLVWGAADQVSYHSGLDWGGSDPDSGSLNGARFVCGYAAENGLLAANSVAAGNWGALISKSGTKTLLDTGVAVTTSLTRLRVELAPDASRVDFLINGANVARCTTAALIPGAGAYTAWAHRVTKPSSGFSATNKIFVLDYTYCLWVPSGDRS